MLVYYEYRLHLITQHFINLLRKLEEVAPDLGKSLKQIELRIELHVESLLAVNWPTDYHVFIDSNVIHGLRFAETFMVVVILLQDKSHAFSHQYLVR